MGNSQGKETQQRPPPQFPQAAIVRPGDSSTSSAGLGSSTNGGQEGHSPAGGSNPSLRHRRGSRHEITLFSIANAERDPSAPEARKETKAEREARKLEKERAQREKDRERSMKEENVDGGYLVTMGVYTGTEDFSKSIVRQLQIERRLAPFWKGLNDFNELWTEHQIVAAVRGLPIPAPDESPPEALEQSPRSSDTNINHLTVPISSRSPSYHSDHSNLSPSHPAFSLPSPTSPFGSPPNSGTPPFFRGRAKTLAALTTSSRNNSQSDMTPQEIQLPKDPNVNGQPIEVFLYKDASECPICFLYYPPYLNKTRCCDQPMCSECFVQIKRPDPHPPEHHDDEPNSNTNGNGTEANDSGEQQNNPSDEYMLVSEPATCPFCKQPEFGITYDPPPFRRGLSYANHANGHPLASMTSAMSSASSINSQSLGTVHKHKRRTTSLGANEPNVITTDKIRPDWAKKLADARSHALRRAAAATALHNAAYVLGNAENARRFGLGRRRRTLFGADSPVGGESSAGNVGVLLAAAERHGEAGSGDTSSDLFPGRHSSRRSRIDDLEELMMMEAIRLSLAAEEERKRKEERDAAKQAKKDEKQKAKDAKKAEKAARKSGIYSAGRNASSLSQMTTGTTNTTGTAGEALTIPGKGKAVDRSGNADAEASSSSPPQTDPKESPQQHLAQSRAYIQSHGGPTLPDSPTAAQVSSSAPNLSPLSALTQPPYHRRALRGLSNASSSASSFTSVADVDSDAPFPARGGGALAGLAPGAASSIEPSPNASAPNLGSNNPFRGRLAAELRADTPTPPLGGSGSGTPSAEPMFNFRSLAAVIGREEDDVPRLELPGEGEGEGEGVDIAKSVSNRSDPYDAKHYGDIAVLESRGASGEAA